MIFKIYYGWQEDGKWCLSVFPPAEGRKIRNEYPTKEAAEEEAKRRGCDIKWQE